MSTKMTVAVLTVTLVYAGHVEIIICVLHQSNIAPDCFWGAFSRVVTSNTWPMSIPLNFYLTLATLGDA